jgi:hypothetical protein
MRPAASAAVIQRLHHLSETSFRAMGSLWVPVRLVRIEYRRTHNPHSDRFGPLTSRLYLDNAATSFPKPRSFRYYGVMPRNSGRRPVGGIGRLWRAENSLAIPPAAGEADKRTGDRACRVHP